MFKYLSPKLRILVCAVAGTLVLGILPASATIYDANPLVASGDASALTPTDPRTRINLKSSTILSGSGQTVFNLKDFLVSNSTLTLKGDASTVFVFNVSDRFSLTSAQIVLSGGVLSSNVIFNYTGSGAARVIGRGIIPGRFLGNSSNLVKSKAITLNSNSFAKKIISIGSPATFVIIPPKPPKPPVISA